MGVYKLVSQMFSSERLSSTEQRSYGNPKVFRETDETTGVSLNE